jgi:hypothetical protein
MEEHATQRLHEPCNRAKNEQDPTKLLEHAYWLAVTVSFVCPACGKPSTEKVAVNSQTDDPSFVTTGINLDIDENGITCRACSRLLSGSPAINVVVKVLPSTLAELKAGGYLSPEFGNDN